MYICIYVYIYIYIYIYIYTTNLPWVDPLNPMCVCVCVYIHILSSRQVHDQPSSG